MKDAVWNEIVKMVATLKLQAEKNKDCIIIFTYDNPNKEKEVVPSLDLRFDNDQLLLMHSNVSCTVLYERNETGSNVSSIKKVREDFHNMIGLYKKIA